MNKEKIKARIEEINLRIIIIEWTLLLASELGACLWYAKLYAQLCELKDELLICNKILDHDKR
jgi:hypothetical protein